MSDQDHLDQGPLDQDHLLKYLKTQAKAIGSLSPQVSRHLTGKPVHELRLATRRTRAVLWCLRHSSDHLRLKKLNRCLQKLGKALGEVRELDVAIRDANHYQIDSTQLKAQRKTAQKKLRKQLRKNQRSAVMSQLSRAEDSARAMKSLSLAQAREDLCARLEYQLGRRIHGQEKFHQLRITLKKVRYSLEAMGRPIKPLKSIQDLLGNAHDLEFLQSLTGKNAKMKTKQGSFNEQAIRRLKPALQFAIAQLGRGSTNLVQSKIQRPPGRFREGSSPKLALNKVQP